MACSQGGSCAWVVFNDKNGRPAGTRCSKCGNVIPR